MTINDKARGVRKLLREEYQADHNWPWIVGFSGGKDSTLLLHFVVNVLKRVAPEDRKREVLIVNNDTLVESPVFQDYVDNQLELLKRNLRILRLTPQVQVVQTHPDVKKTFWTLLLGRGYPAPNPGFRWCTNNMKIKPTVKLLKEKTKSHGSAVLLLGVRKAESARRKRTITEHEKNRTHNYPNFTPHTDVRSCHVFTPLKDWETFEVFEALIAERPSWGGRHKEMLNLYMEADDAECPFVVSEQDSAGCGTNSARFGCWTCTVIKKDKALVSLAKEREDDSLQLLSNFRSRIREVSDDPEFRCFVRRNGQEGLGPLTMKARKMLLSELLKLQKKVNKTLISEREIIEIRHQWELDESTEIKRKFGLGII